MELKLHSPVGAEPIAYPWPGTERLNTEDEIKTVIKWVCNDFPELKLPLQNNVLSKIEEDNDFESMKALCDRFNRAVDAAAALRKGIHHTSTTASEELLKFILGQVYVMSVTDPSELNQYEPFSPEVYGETSFDLIAKMVQQISISEDDCFIDLGSGIGQVVLQMAALTKCKICIGIEKAEVPNKYADAMNVQFKKWMAWFGKSYGKYELIKGDFLNEDYRKTIVTSSILFVNNFAFGPNVDHMLKERFADLKDGARIVSSKSFCPLNFRITDRNLSDIGTIMHVSEMQPLQGSVSWTGNTVLFYLHVIDRTKLERYFQKLKNVPRGGRDSCTSQITDNYTDDSSSRQFSQRNSDNTSDDESTDNGSPPRVTTRRAWSDYVKTKSSGDEEASTRSSSRPKRILPRTSKSLAVTPATMQQTQVKSSSRKKAAKGRRTKPKRPIKISGLDLLHNETLLSTSPEKVGRKPPPAPGCVDQQLTSLMSSLHEVHEELEIPPVPAATPYGLQILINSMRDMYLAFFEQMKQPTFRENVTRQIEEEKKRKDTLTKQTAQLERQIKYLTDDSVSHLRARVYEIGIHGEVNVERIFKHARDIVMHHKDLQKNQAKLNDEIVKLEDEYSQLLTERCAELKIEKRINGPVLNEHIFEEIIATKSSRQKLLNNISNLNQEIIHLEKQCYEQQQKRLLIEKMEKARLEKLANSKPVIQHTDSEKRHHRAHKEEPRIGFTANKVYESPRVANFEERLKSIITTALKEDNPPRLTPTDFGRSTKSHTPSHLESPGKQALRRHLSQEKVSIPKMKKPRPRTIGDLVSVEIERSFEKDYSSKPAPSLLAMELESPRSNSHILPLSQNTLDPYDFTVQKFEIKEEPVEGLAASLHESLFNGEVKEEPVVSESKMEPEILKRALSDDDFFPNKRIDLDNAPSPVEGEKWKDKVSSGFDRLVAFASSVDAEKRRKSTESGSAHSSPGTEREPGGGGGSSKCKYSLDRGDSPPPVLEPLQQPSSPPPTSPLPLLPLDGPYSPVNKPPPPTPASHNHFKKKFFQRNWKLQK